MPARSAAPARRVVYATRIVGALSAIGVAAIPVAWAFGVWNHRPVLTLMGYLLFLALTTGALILHVLCRVQAGVAEAFGRGIDAGLAGYQRVTPTHPPGKVKRLRAVD